MSGEKERVEGYLVKRLEPDIHMIGASAFYASAAISLKRMADAAERIADALCNPIVYSDGSNLTQGGDLDYCKMCDRQVTKADAVTCLQYGCMMKT